LKKAKQELQEVDRILQDLQEQYQLQIAEKKKLDEDAKSCKK